MDKLFNPEVWLTEVRVNRRILFQAMITCNSVQDHSFHGKEDFKWILYIIIVLAENIPVFIFDKVIGVNYFPVVYHPAFCNGVMQYFANIFSYNFHCFLLVNIILRILLKMLKFKYFISV